MNLHANVVSKMKETEEEFTKRLIKENPKGI